MPETWIWLVAGAAVIGAAIVARALIVRRWRRQEPPREDIYPMF